ncbi:SCO family protein [Nocardioides dongxiaopingii]|uniref:SCO family protein n=1 Tax=Nocardioides sp. S-1144 TaxID=2582905 RepID=UPI00110EA71C|nr:SCO family protein [Nocardioides sp. S-1144]QCW50453.1 SCO family protein [Nocardioides sp. S-1144]
MRRPVRSRPAAVALVVSLALGLGLGACGGDDDAAPFSGKVLQNPYDVPATELVDTDGDAYSLADSTDKRLTLVFFGYVNCVDVCPAVLTNLASAMTRLDDADRDAVDVVMVTSDPDRDTPEALRSYLDQFDDDFIGLTSDFDTIVEVGRALAVGIDRKDPGGHTTQVMGVDPTDQAPVYWDATTSPSQYAADIHSLLEES